MQVYAEMDWDTYQPPAEAQELFDRICDQDKLPELEAYIERCYPAGVSEMDIDDVLRDYDNTLENELGLEDEDDEADETDIDDYDKDERGY